MELAFLLRQVGSQVVWITNQRSEETNDVTYSLEHKMLSHGVQVCSTLLSSANYPYVSRISNRSSPR